MGGPRNNEIAPSRLLDEKVDEPRIEKRRIAAADEAPLVGSELETRVEPSERVRTGDQVLARKDWNNVTTYYHPDHLGSASSGKAEC